MAKPLCPICNKPATGDDKPFCSKRCANIDLGRWFKGSYSVPVVEDDDLPDEGQEPGDENVH